MDYLRIYRDFIRDRMANPPRGGEVIEIHHIRPRTMGGTDDPQNLIRLTTGDHFFAHLLLAKGHKVRELWWAVFVMLDTDRGRKITTAAGHRQKNLSGIVGGRRNYEWLAARRGDPTIFHFRHHDGREMHATQMQFQAATGTTSANTSALVNNKGKRGSSKGWYLPEHNPRGLVRGVTMRGSGSFNADDNIYHFSHDDGREEHLTRLGLAEKHKLRYEAATRLIDRSRVSYRGWMLHEVRLMDDRDRHLNRNEVLTFVHDRKGEFSGSRADIARHIVCESSLISMVMNGGAAHARGWYPKDRPVPMLKRVQGEVFTFVHPTKGEVTGTQAEIARLAGISTTEVCRTIAGSAKSRSGWTQKGAAPIPSKVKVMTFEHPQYGRFTGTRSEIARHIGVSGNSVSVVARGDAEATRGWRLVPDLAMAAE